MEIFDMRSLRDRWVFVESLGSDLAAGVPVVVPVGGYAPALRSQRRHPQRW